MPSYICVDTAQRDAFRKATEVAHWTPKREILETVTEDQASHTAALTALEALETLGRVATQTWAAEERLVLTKLEAQVAHEVTSRENILAQEEARRALKIQELKAQVLRLALTELEQILAKQTQAAEEGWVWKLEAQVAHEATFRETILAQEVAEMRGLEVQELKAQEEEVREQRLASQLAAIKSALTDLKALETLGRCAIETQATEEAKEAKFTGRLAKLEAREREIRESILAHERRLMFNLKIHEPAPEDRLKRCEDLRTAASFFAGVTERCPFCTQTQTQKEFTRALANIKDVLLQWPPKS